MIEVADIFRLHSAAYQAVNSLCATPQKVLRQIVDCRTAGCGGHVVCCDHCGYQRYSYHSCKNRHCPKCQGQQTQRWLQKHQERLLPCGYYLLTFTLPEGLRALAWSHPKAIYNLLMSSAAAALQKLAWDARYVGAQLALLGVLHTWTRAMLYHPHVHVLVSAGGLSKDGQRWVAPKNPAFLVPGYALSKIFRGKFRAGLKKRALGQDLPADLWKEKWVVHCQHAGSGKKVLEYLARYVFRVAISHHRIDRFENGEVTFHYRDNRTQQLKWVTLGAFEFIRRFLLHVLPKGFMKVRSYGLWAPNAPAKLQEAKTLLSAIRPDWPALNSDRPKAGPLPPPLCPKCHHGHLTAVLCLLPYRPRAP